MINTANILHGKILIVDDQAANIILLERMLRTAGYDSITSTMDPKEVCALHRKHCYDLIMLDLRMPGMDGFEVIQDLKEIEIDGYLLCSSSPRNRVTRYARLKPARKTSSANRMN